METLLSVTHQTPVPVNKLPEENSNYPLKFWWMIEILTTEPWWKLHVLMHRFADVPMCLLRVEQPKICEVLH